MVKNADVMITQQLQKLIDDGLNPEDFGLPGKTEYDAMRKGVEDYTDGKAMFMTWRWPDTAVPAS
jgi:hypothetical protein